MIQDNVLLGLATWHKMYKTDAVMYARRLTNGDDRYARRVIDSLIKKNMLEEDTVASTRKKSVTYKTVALTSIAEEYLKKKLDYTVDKEIKKTFYSLQEANIRKRLNDSRIGITFACAGVPLEKPPLAEVYDSLKKGESLKEGYYYTLKEIHTFLDEEEKGKSDTTYRSRIRGMYISQKTCLFVYISSRGDNKFIRTTMNAEKKLINALRPLIELTDVYRTLPLYSPEGKDGFTIFETPAQNEPWGLVISDGDSLVYSMAIGNPNGIVKKHKKRNEDYEPKYTWLKADTPIYKRLFVVPFTVAGIGSLDYLCHTPVENWLEESKEMFNASETFELNAHKTIYPADDISSGKKVSAIFMPVYEVTELNNIAKSNTDVCVLTYPDMYNAISHSVMREIKFCNAEEMKHATSIMKYGTSGRTRGEEILIKEMSRMKLSCNKNEFKKLPKKYGMDRVSFFNAVAEGEINLEEIIKDLPIRQKQDKNKKSPPHKRVSLVIPTKLKTLIKTAANKKDMSVNRYIIDIIVRNIEEIKKDAGRR